MDLKEKVYEIICPDAVLKDILEGTDTCFLQYGIEAKNYSKVLDWHVFRKNRNYERFRDFLDEYWEIYGGNGWQMADTPNDEIDYIFDQVILERGQCMIERNSVFLGNIGIEVDYEDFNEF